MYALSPRVIFDFPEGYTTMFDLENFGGGSMFEMMSSSLKVPECKPVLYRELLCMLLTES